MVESKTATELEGGGLWMRAQGQRDALPRQRDKHSTSSSSSKRDAKQHGYHLIINALIAS